MRKTKQYCQLLVAMALFFLSFDSKASQFCFASASTYYENVYCELEVKGQVKNLPPFDQFKKNTEIVQFSLLKSLAERNSIKLPAPAKKIAEKENIREKDIREKDIRKSESGSKKIHKDILAPVQLNEPSGSIRAPGTERARIKVTSSFDCEMHSKVIVCGNHRYHLLGNKGNKRLASGVLNEDNKMALPTYEDGQTTDSYLATAYEQYIRKMCDIGLAGFTMTFAKFAYFYQDLKEKGVSFTQRFEIMYRFLKKDKATMWISEKVPVVQLSINDCDVLSRQYYICAKLGQNYIFELE